jgi:hypothetical protein
MSLLISREDWPSPWGLNDEKTSLVLAVPVEVGTHRKPRNTDRSKLLPLNMTSCGLNSAILSGL